MAKDVIGLRDEDLEGDKLLRLMMKDGKILRGPEPLEVIRRRCRSELESLDESCRAICDPRPYPVELSEKLSALQEKTVREVMEKELRGR